MTVKKGMPGLRTFLLINFYVLKRFGGSRV